MNQKFTDRVRSQTRPYWEGSFVHPFITGIQDGTLPMENFRYYLIQDCYYLEHFSHIYALVAAQTTFPELKKRMEENAAHLKAGELAVRETFFKELLITDQELQNTEIAPTAYNYVSHLYRQLVEGNDWIIAASLLPCPWLYADIGVYLKNKQSHSPNPFYQQWIDTYGGEEGLADIKNDAALLNAAYEQSKDEQKKQMEQAFVISAKMEFSFWEMAYQFESWPKGLKEECEER